MTAVLPPPPVAALDVSVILPCLNEAATVAPCVKDAVSWLARSGTRGEVIVVDNGSTDGSIDLAAAAGARTLSESSRGKGFAVLRGIEAARGDLIVIADADGTYDLSNLDPLIQPLRQGYDMVTGNRLRGTMQPRAMPWLHRHVGNPLITAAISLITRRKFGDCLSGLRAFRREAWLEMGPRSHGFELETEICLRAARRGLHLAEVPVSYGARRTESKLRALTHGWEIARFIILDSADILFLAPALIAILIGILSLVIGTVRTHGVEVGTVRWQPVFAGGILLPGGASLLTLGLAAKWLAWQRGLARPGAMIRLVTNPEAPAFEILLFGGLVLLTAGLGLDGFLLFRWGTNNPPPLPLGLGAVAQALVVTGLNLMVSALLLGVLRAASGRVGGPDAAGPATLPGSFPGL